MNLPEENKTVLSFEIALQELSKIVENLEQHTASLDLELALKEFERGIELTRLCQTQLEQATQRVKILSAPTKESPLLNFSSSENLE